MSSRTKIAPTINLIFLYIFYNNKDVNHINAFWFKKILKLRFLKISDQTFLNSQLKILMFKKSTHHK